MEATPQNSHLPLFSLDVHAAQAEVGMYDADAPSGVMQSAQFNRPAV
jgi:hypothetical protein